jgi:hypothetical protein
MTEVVKSFMQSTQSKEIAVPDMDQVGWLL